MHYAGHKKWTVGCTECPLKAELAGADIRRGRGGQCPCANNPNRRFWTKVNATDNCWLWCGAKQSDGYGSFRVGSGKTALAHKWSWEQVFGPVPQGKELDHVCRNRACVRPDHLEAVTHQENVARGNMPSIVRARGYAV